MSETESLNSQEKQLLARVLQLQNRMREVRNLNHSVSGMDARLLRVEANLRAALQWIERGRWRQPHNVRRELDRLVQGAWKTLEEFDLRGPDRPLPTFDEDAYLLVNPDIAFAMRQGLYSGLEHWLHHGQFERRAGGPWLLPLAEPDVRSGIKDRPYGLNYYAPVGEASGLGSAARGYWNAMRSGGVPSMQYSIPSWENHHDRTGLAPALYRINLIHQNPDQMPLFTQTYGAHRLHNSYNIGFWVWELASMPNRWFPFYAYVDEIWAPSEFARECFATMTNMPTMVLPHVVDDLEKHVTYGRDYFNFAPDVFVFGMVFDVSSYFDRKNPMAAVQAFQKAFGDRKDVLLVLKYSRPEYDRFQVQDLEDLAATLPNVRTMSGIMSHEEIVSLHAAFDCYVSPHRSEGFGLNLAESMYLGKPVIGTRYSGNVDFMDEANSYGIDYKLTAIGRNMGPYHVGSCWANPSIEHLASLMQRVLVEKEERANKARLGQERVRKQLNRDVVGRQIAQRLEEIGAREPDPVPYLPPKPSLFRQPMFAPNTPSNYIEELLGWNYRPVISVVVPSRNMEPEWLELCIESVRKQYYPFWELCLQDDGTTLEGALDVMRKYRGLDHRIKIRRSEQSQGISTAMNKAAEMASGEFIAFLDSDDELTPDALFHVVRELQREPDIDFFYTDEDKIEMDGSYSETYFKPEWSPDMLRSMMYVLHMMVVRNDVFWNVGGFRPEFTWSQDYDLALRLTLKARKVRHIPKVLYHWRKIPGSAAAVLEAKPQALEAARRAVEEHVKEAGFDATVELGLLPGLFRVRHKIQGDPPVSLCVLTTDKSTEVEGRGHINLLSHFLHSVAEKTTYKNYEIVIVDDGQLSDETRQRLKDLPVRVCSYMGRDKRFNFSKKANWAIRNAAHEHVFLLNDDMEVIRGEWLEAMLEFSQQHDVGAVGAKLLFPDGRIQHAGVALGLQGTAAHLFHLWPGDQPGYNAYTHVIRNYSAVTAACIASRKAVWEEVGGLDETFPIDYNDIDLCLRIGERGYRIIYTPYAELYHFENVVLERRAQDPREVERFFKRWRSKMINDPYLNPNVDRDYLDCRPKMFGHWPRID